MRRGVEVDRATRLRQPHQHAVPLQKPGDLLELAIGEGALELPHDHRVEQTIRVLRPLQQRRSLRSPLPRHPPGDADVEELRRDRPVPSDQRRGHLPLPRLRRHRILVLRVEVRP
jgi:hypothetical protein